ncbi:hypothetical protein EVAR_37787_1 [Eumeta japonica]|uniref:Uncharacterized protein n=1 Tax=Eumeta variegata TaxID=151549 RepID=A0A4C1W784_EUMVA|nr:hypothetical protein EVAR_37787_1 [Eumeta japonica]
MSKKEQPFEFPAHLLKDLYSFRASNTAGAGQGLQLSRRAALRRASLKDRYDEQMAARGKQTALRRDRGTEVNTRRLISITLAGIDYISRLTLVVSSFPVGMTTSSYLPLRCAEAEHRNRFLSVWTAENSAPDRFEYCNQMRLSAPPRPADTRPAGNHAPEVGSDRVQLTFGARSRDL